MTKAPITLKRDEVFLREYEFWLVSQKRTALQKFKEAYISGFYGMSNPSCEVIRTPTYARLILKADAYFEANTCRFLMDFIREIMLKKGYYSYMSDIRNEEGLEIERHYLKPDVFEAMKKGEPVDRRFGNLTLELFLEEEEEALYLTLTLGFYHERESKREKSLDELMEVLLETVGE